MNPFFEYEVGDDFLNFEEGGEIGANCSVIGTTSRDLLEKCLSALHRETPRTLGDLCDKYFIEEEGGNFIKPLGLQLNKMNFAETLHRKIQGYMAPLNAFMLFFKHIYNKRCQWNYTKPQLYDLLWPYEYTLNRVLLNIEGDKVYPRKAIFVYLFTGTVHLLVLQELALLDPRVSDHRNSEHTAVLKKNSARYISHVLQVCAPHFVETLNIFCHPNSELDEINETTMRELSAYTDGGFVSDDTLKKFLLFPLDKKSARLKGTFSSQQVEYSQLMVNSVDLMLHSPVRTTMHWLKMTVQPFYDGTTLTEVFILYPFPPKCIQQTPDLLDSSMKEVDVPTNRSSEQSSQSADTGNKTNEQRTQVANELATCKQTENGFEAKEFEETKQSFDSPAPEDPSINVTNKEKWYHEIQLKRGNSTKYKPMLNFEATLEHSMLASELNNYHPESYGYVMVLGSEDKTLDKAIPIFEIAFIPFHITVENGPISKDNYKPTE